MGGGREGEGGEGEGRGREREGEGREGGGRAGGGRERERDVRVTVRSLFWKSQIITYNLL